MKIAYFPNQVALNGQLTLRCFLNSAKSQGFTPVENSMDADAAVIWSVLWNGRLQPNKIVYEHYRSQGKPVFILEVGALKRGYTWKVALNDITSSGIYGNVDNLDVTRSGKIGVTLLPSKENRKKEILIACQHQKSHQMQGQQTLESWLLDTVSNIKTYTDRPILIRPHPRSQFSFRIPGTTMVTPKRLPNTHEEYDIDYNFHCVVNLNSGPSIVAAIKGTPIICDSSSLAYSVSGKIQDIETIILPDREKWFVSICHTEWTNDEINRGLPIGRLIPYINR
jgi:hypothetical protein